MNVAVLVSGAGTIMEAMLAAGVPVAVVAADRPCRGLEVADAAGVPAVISDRREFGGFTKAFDRDAYCDALVEALLPYCVDLVAMAGFGTIVNAAFHAAYERRILNTHPSLLPAFKGWHAVADALDAKATVTGCTVHVATLELDEGPILAQAVVPIHEGDTPEGLQERIKEVERKLYPQTILTALDRLEHNQPLVGSTGG